MAKSDFRTMTLESNYTPKCDVLVMWGSAFGFTLTICAKERGVFQIISLISVVGKPATVKFASSVGIAATKGIVVIDKYCAVSPPLHRHPGAFDARPRRSRCRKVNEKKRSASGGGEGNVCTEFRSVTRSRMHEGSQLQCIRQTSISILQYNQVVWALYLPTSLPREQGRERFAPMLRVPSRKLAFILWNTRNPSMGVFFMSCTFFRVFRGPGMTSHSR